MDSRRWWLLAGSVPVTLGCAVSAAQPAQRVLGELAVIIAGLLAGGVLWFGARRTSRPKIWRLMAAAPLFPVLGAVAAAVAPPLGPAQAAVLRWLPTIPGYLIAIVAILALVDRSRRRAAPRLAVEVALFLGACLIVVNLLMIGPADRLAGLPMTQRLVLVGAVVVTSATMAAALTLVSLIESGRRPMALVLLAGAALLTLGRGLGTAAVLSGESGPVGAARFLVAGGLLLLALAVVLDAGATRRSESPVRRSSDVGHLLPHLALLVAVAAVGGATLSGSRPGAGAIGVLVACVGLAAVHRWLTAREEQRLGARLRRSESYFRSLVQSGGDAVVIVDGDLRITWASDSLERSLGQAAGRLPGRPLLETVHPEDVVTLAAALPLGAGTPGEPAAHAGLLLFRLQDDEGVWRYLEAGVSDLRRDPDVGGVVLHCRDMTERHAREQALQGVAYTDPMTGLPNRAGLLQALQPALSEAGDLPASLLLIELDGLVAARENAGREAASTVVAEVGRRIRATVRGEDVVARMGGGAFAVLSHGEDADADRLAARILSVVEQPILTRGGVVDLTAGVGLVALECGIGVEALLGRGELAVRAAHEAGAGSAQRYREALGEAATRREQLRTDLRSACAREELFLLFQPIVSLGEQRITGVEAQLRWRHGTLGEIPSAEFLPLAERAGLIGEFTRWALEEVAAAAAELPEGIAPQMGLKLPDGYLATGAIVTDVEDVLRRTGLAPQRLVLQIGAQAVTSEDGRIGLDISSLRLMGVHVALEGFGSGTSALGHLTRFPIDILKLDRSLITRIDRDSQSRALCESLVGIGRALGLDVVAEGVETAAQLAALCGFGCGFAQGFLLARPMPLAELLVTLAAGELWPGLVGSQ